MKNRKTLALILTFVGLILIVAGPFIPGGIHLVPNHPVGMGHVTTLTSAPSGELFAGTQSGDVWRFHEGLWTRERVNAGGQPVMAMLGDPRSSPVGTSAGLVNAPAGTPPLDGRVSSLLQTDEGLLAGTGSGVRLLTESGWQSPGPQANIYSLFRQRTSAGDWIYASTVDAGVLSTPADHVEMPWSPDNHGLPKGAKTFSFASTEGGRLLVGTDDGLFWQAGAGKPWNSLSQGLEGKRVTALYLAAGQGKAGAQRLWIGSDDGLSFLDLKEDAGSLSAMGGPHFADSADHQPGVGISWILPNGKGLVVSASLLFDYGPTKLQQWFWISIAGVLLVIIAGLLMPRPAES